MIIAALLLVVSTKQPIVGAILFLIGMVIAAPESGCSGGPTVQPDLDALVCTRGEICTQQHDRQPGRVAITASTLMIGLATLIMIASLVTSMGQLITKLVADTFNSDILILPPTIGIYTSIIGADENLAKRVQALPDVQTVAACATLRVSPTIKGWKSWASIHRITRRSATEFINGNRTLHIRPWESGET